MINIADVASLDRITILSTTDKRQALKDLAGILGTAETITDPSALESAILDREQIMSTGIGLGVAVPHVRLAGVSALTLALGVSRAGIDYNAFDGDPVHILIMIAAPEGAHREYLSLLAKIALLLKNETIRERIIKAETPGDIFDIIKGY